MDRIFKGRPEAKLENPDYLDGLTEALESLSDEELAWVSDIRDGVAARCKFLPTPADVFELIRDKRAALDRVRPSHTSYARLQPEPEPVHYETDASRRKRTVEAALGYNPNSRLAARNIAPITDAEIRAVLDKSPYRNAVISDAMRELLKAKPSEAA